ncbi:MAG TPA: hypothetical protein PK402_01420 [Tepidisphaeraceae bacterium]|nr:hypothetical protein [Tepidisphaeraceae bacterium]
MSKHRPKILAGMLSASLLALASCQSDAPPPARVPVQADASTGPVRYHIQPKPIYADQPQADIPLPIDDPPLITQAPPEQTQFLEAYERVGRPRIVVFVNRTIDGNIITIAPESLGPVGTNAQPSGPVDGPMNPNDAYQPQGRQQDTQARTIDFEAMELVIGDLFAANGRVSLTSPSMARTALTDAQINQIQNGQSKALRVMAETLDTDVLIQVQARPTQQTQNGVGIRVLAEAIDVATGESRARAFVDVPPPLTKTTLQKYSRYLSRKLMYSLAGSWRYVPNNSPGNGQGTAPNSPPALNPTAMPPTVQPIPTPPSPPKDAPAPPPAPSQPPTP